VKETETQNSYSRREDITIPKNSQRNSNSNNRRREEITSDEKEE
jgi:hypothetical protein